MAYEYRDTYGYTYLSADHIAAELQPENPAEARLQAGRLFLERFRRMVDERRHVILETTLAGRGVERMIEDLDAAGYTVRIAFVFLDSPALCLERIQGRVERGGHDVPRDDVVRRYGRSLNNFWWRYRHQVTRWHLYHNAGDNFQSVAVGERQEIITLDEILFERFIRALER
ncbi:MAG: zeta toxin family protein [Bacteroidota bacterium]